MTDAITLRSTVSGTYTRVPLTTAGQCWLPSAWPSSTQVAHRDLDGLRRQRVETDDHDVAQRDLRHDRATRRVVPEQDVAVAQQRPAVERDGHFEPL